MSNEVQLRLPAKKQKLPGSVWLPIVIMAVALAASTAVIGVQVILRARTGGIVEDLHRADIEALALKLESQKLSSAAVETWLEYLGSARLTRKDRAALWFRIGKIHEESGEYEQAVKAYYRSEAWYEDPELSFDIGRRVEDSLERLGKFAALRQELAGRVGMAEPEEADDVVAEIGATKVRASDLDQLIEDMISDQLAGFAAFMTEDELRRRKEETFKAYATEEQRASLLSQYLTEELLYRQAREAGISDEPSTRNRILRAERSVLAQTVLQRELADKINITDVDLQTYYSANAEDFRTHEQARVAHILVGSEEAARSIRTRAAGGTDFEDLARMYSGDSATAQAGGAIGTWIVKGDPLPDFASSVDTTAAIFSTEPGDVYETVVQTERGYHVIKVLEREPSRLRGFEEVRREVYQQLYAQKARDVQEQLLAFLRTKYDVVIHQGALSGAQGEPGGDGSTN